MKKFPILICVLLCVALTACSPQTKLLDFIGEDSDELDFGGHTVSIYFDGGGSEIGDMKIFGYQIGSIEEDAVLNRLSEIEKNNCTIKLDGSHTKNSAKIKLMAGDPNMDLVMFHAFGAMQDFAKGQLLTPITDFPDIIDLNDSKKYGTANILEASMINSKPYSVQPIQWPGYQPLECYVMVFNKDLLQSNGHTDFHEYYENEMWTWNTYENEVLKKIKIQSIDGIMPTLYTHEANFFKSMIFSNNNKYITKDENGENQIHIYSEEFVNAFTTACNWYSEYRDVISLQGDYWEIDLFLEGNAVSTLATPDKTTTGVVAYNDKGNFSHGLMPFPCGPQSPYGKWAQCMERSKGFGISVTSKEPEIAAHVIDMMFEPFEEFGGKDGLYDYYKNNVFLNEVDAEIYFALCENVRYDYGFDGGGNGPGSNIQDYFSAALKSGKPVQEALDSYKGAMKNMIEEYMLENYDYVYENYYSQLEN